MADLHRVFWAYLLGPIRTSLIVDGVDPLSVLPAASSGWVQALDRSFSDDLTRLGHLDWVPRAPHVKEDQFEPSVSAALAAFGRTFRMADEVVGTWSTLVEAERERRHTLGPTTMLLRALGFGAKVERAVFEAQLEGLSPHQVGRIYLRCAERQVGEIAARETSSRGGHRRLQTLADTLAATKAYLSGAVGRDTVVTKLTAVEKGAINDLGYRNDERWFLSLAEDVLIGALRFMLGLPADDMNDRNPIRMARVSCESLDARTLGFALFDQDAPLPAILGRNAVAEVTAQWVDLEPYAGSN